MGTEGWPTLPRIGSPRISSPSASSARMMTVTVWAERPLRRAISALERLPCRRTSDMTRRSL
jgi:hypothetical protein